MTIRELRNLCDGAIEYGFGDCNVIVPADEEWNGFHDLSYGFTTNQEDVQYAIYSTCSFMHVTDVEHSVILG